MNTNAGYIIKFMGLDDSKDITIWIYLINNSKMLIFTMKINLRNIYRGSEDKIVLFRLTRSIQQFQELCLIPSKLLSSFHLVVVSPGNWIGTWLQVLVYQSNPWWGIERLREADSWALKIQQFNQMYIRLYLAIGFGFC